MPQTVEERFEDFKTKSRFDEFKQRMESQGALGETEIEDEPTFLSVAQPPEEIGQEGDGERFPTGAFIGGTAGAIAGTAAAPFAGPLAPYMPYLGATGGAGLGEAAEQLIRGEELDPSQIGKEAALGLVGEAGGRALVWTGGKVLAPFAKKVTPEAKRAIKFMQGYLKQPLLPGEAVENKLLRVLENVGENAWLGSTPMKAFRTNRDKVINNIVDDVAEMFGKQVDPDILGEMFEKTIKGQIKASRLISDPLYNTAEQIATDRGVEVGVKSLRDMAKPMMKMVKELKGLEAKNAGDDLVKMVMAMTKPSQKYVFKNNKWVLETQKEKFVDYAVAKELRSRLISVVDEFQIINKAAPARGKAKRFIKWVDQAMEKSLKKQAPDAHDFWREANAIYRDTSKKYDNKFIRALMKKGDPNFGGEPEMIAEAIFKPRRISRIKGIKEAVDGKTWEKFQSWYTHDLLRKSSTGGKIIGSKLESNMFGRNGMGEKALREIYTAKEFKTMKELLNAIKMTQINPEAGGGMYIQLVQASTSAVLLSGAYRKSAAIIMLGPGLLSRVLTYPKTAQLLIQGYKLPVGSPLLGGVFGRFAAEIAKMKTDERKELPIPTPGAIGFQ